MAHGCGGAAGAGRRIRGPGRGGAPAAAVRAAPCAGADPPDGRHAGGGARRIREARRPDPPALGRGPGADACIEGLPDAYRGSGTAARQDGPEPRADPRRELRAHGGDHLAAFLVVFRNGAARLMAMIPSLFAILTMFLVMRLTGMMLNIATILIASTVLGTSENDQIHFFYHFLEGRRGGTVEQALTHTLMIAGRAIFFATIINAGGFLAFVGGELPPIRQFGVLAALAFVLSMIADFTALPAALWILLRERPAQRPAPDP